MNWNPFIKFPKVCLITFILCLIPFALFFRDFSLNSQVEVLLAGDQRNFESYQKIKEVISTSIPIFVSLKVDNIYSSEGLQAIHRVSEAFDDMEGFLDAKSLTHSYKPVRKGFSFDMVPLASTNAVDAETLENLRNYCRDNPLIRNVITSPDDQHNLIWLTFNRDFGKTAADRPVLIKKFSDELHARMAPFKDEGFDYKLIGIPTVENEVYQTLISDTKRFALITSVVLVVLFLWSFRSILAAGLVALNLGMATFLIPGVYVLLNFDLTVFTVILLPLLGVIHLTLLTHIFLSYFHAMRSGSAQPVESSFEKIWKSSAFAALTTTVSFASLMISSVSQVALFGLLGAVGMVLIFLISFGPGLSLLKIIDSRGLFNNQTQRSTLSDNQQVWISKWVQGVTQNAKWITGISLLIVIFAGFGLSKVRTDIRLEEFLGHESDTRQMMMEMNDVYGGMNILQLYADSGRNHGIISVENLNYLQDLAHKAKSLEGVTGVYSFSQIVAMMNQVWENEKPGSLAIPKSSFTVNMFISALKAQNYPFLTTLADEDMRTATLVVRTQNMPSKQYLELVDKLLALSKESAPEGMEISAKAAVKSLIQADRKILRSQTDTAGFTLLIVFVLLIFLWRSVASGAISMVANVLPVALVLSLTGWFNIPLNSITIMVGAIAFGIAVDDSVHFLTFYREFLKKNPDQSKIDALVSTFEIKGRPIFFTSIKLVSVFLLLSISSFPPIQHFGLLGAAAFATALASVFLLLPALLTVRDKNTSKIISNETQNA